MHIKDHNDAMTFFRTYDSVASKGKWKEFVDEMEFDSMLQEPRTPAADGGRIGLKPGGLVEPGVMYYAKKKGMDKANLKRQMDSIQSYYDQFGKETLDKIAKKRHGKVFDKLGGADLSNLKVRVTKYKDFIIENNRMPSETEARKFGRVDRDITLSLVNKDKTVNIDAVRENLIKNKKKVTMVNNQFIFADEKLQQEFLDDMILRYKYPKTSTAAKNAGVKSNKQLFETYFKGTYSEKGVHDLINRFKKTLGEDFSRLHPSERNAHKLRRQAKLLITQAGKRISGLDDFPSHHLFPIGDEFAHGTQDFTILDKQTNSQLSGSNKKLVGLAEQRTQLVNDVSSGKISSKNFDIEMGKLDNQAQTIIDGHYKKFPKHDGLLNWRKATSILDNEGRFMDIQSTGTIGGDASKWAVTDVNKQIKDLSKTELATFRSDIKAKTLDNKKLLKFFKDSGIPCIKGAGGQCNSIVDYQKGYNKIVKEAAEGSAKAIKKIGGFTKLMRGGLGAAKWTGYGLLAEAGFMVPFAIGDYAAGESWKRILGNATDYGFGPILGQSEQEEFEAALPEGSLAVEGEKAWELSEQLHALDEQKFRPQGRIGMDQARREESRENVITGITDEFSENLQPFLSDTPFAKDQWHQGMWDQAHEEAAATRAQIEKEKQQRIDERIERGIIADKNWQSQVQGRADGGIMNLKKKW